MNQLTDLPRALAHLAPSGGAPADPCVMVICGVTGGVTERTHDPRR